MLLTLSRAFLALTLSALLVFLVGAPVLVRHYGDPFVDAFLAPFGLERLGGELSFNPLKLQLTVADLQLAHRNRAAATRGPAKTGQIDLLTLDFFNRRLSLSNGWLTLDSAATALAIDREQAAGLDAEGWLQPLNRLFLDDIGNELSWPSELELPRAVFHATIRHVSLNNFEIRLADTGSVFRIDRLDGSLLGSEKATQTGRVGGRPGALHNWDIDARINERAFQLSVHPQRTPQGAIFYLELKDLQFSATDFSSRGLVLPPLPGLGKLVILEGQIGMAGELVVEFEADKRALTAIELQLDFTGLRGQSQYIDNAREARTLDLRTEQFSAEIDQLQWLANDQRWSPERIRLQADSEFVLPSLRFPAVANRSEAFISSKSATAELLIDWQKNSLFEVHSDQLAIQGLKAHLDDRVLPLVEGVLALCGLPGGLAPEREDFSIDTSLDIAALTAYQDSCWFRQLTLDGTELGIADGEPTPSLEPLRFRQHRLAITDFSTVSSPEPTAIEFSGVMRGPTDAGTPLNIVINLLDNTPELIRFGMTGFQPDELNHVSQWLRRLIVLPMPASTPDLPARAASAMTLELGRLGSAYSGSAQIRRQADGDEQHSQALTFQTTPAGDLSSELWSPLLTALLKLNSKP